jgi:aspartate racemase
MKTIGIIGGLTWLSTIEYYRLLNQGVNEKLGGVSSAKIILYSVEFEEIKKLTVAGQWDGIAAIIADAARRLEKAGADCLLIGANTMHKIADEIKQAVSIPIIHIAEVTANAVKAQQLTTVALLGTKYTMQLNFYTNRFAAKNINIIIPGEEDAEFINNSIYNEMGKNIFLPSTKQRYIAIIHKLVEQGAQGIVLGCTEIPLIIKQADSPVPVFDTTAIHVKAAIQFALG